MFKILEYNYHRGGGNIISKKLRAFLQANMINKTQFEALEKLVQELSTYDLTKVDTFITHLVMCFNRANNKQLVEKMDDVLIAEIQNNAKIEFANSMIKKVEEWSQQKINSDEIPYLQLHLLSIVGD